MGIVTRDYFEKKLDEYVKDPNTPELDKYFKDEIIQKLRLGSRPSIGLFSNCSKDEMLVFKELLSAAIESEKDKGRITLIELHNGHYPLGYFHQGSGELIKAFCEYYLDKAIKDKDFDSSFSFKISDYKIYEKNIEYLEAELFETMEDVKLEFNID